MISYFLNKYKWLLEERGQASIELIAIVPILLLVLIGVVQLFSYGAATDSAASAVEAGAIALIQGENATAVIANSLPSNIRKRAKISVTDREVKIVVEPSMLLGSGKFFNIKVSRIVAI